MAKQTWRIMGTLAHAEREVIRSTLQACEYKISGTAKRLGIGRSTLYRLMETYEISQERTERAAEAEPKIYVRSSSSQLKPPSEEMKFLLEVQDGILMMVRTRQLP
jgi:hypothetical protein